MAEAVATGDAPVDATEPNTAEQPKEVQKQPVKRTAKPNIEEVKAKVSALHDAIAATKARQDAIRKDLDGRRRQGSDSESNEIRKQLIELRTQFQAVLASKKSAREDLDGATKAREALRTQVRSMKTKMEYTTVEKIDEQLRRMESQLQHTSMPLAEEKKIVENMEKLRKSRGSVAQYSSQMEKLNGEDDYKSIMDRLKGYDDDLTNIKSKEETLRSQLSELRTKDDAKNSDVPKLQQELADGKVLVRESYSTIDKLRDDLRAKQDEWWEGEQAWRKQRQIDRERRDVEFAAMRAEKDAERKQLAKELAGEPFDKEVSMCEQLQGYLSRYQESSKTTTSSQDVQDVKALDGMNIYTKKKVEDDNPFAGLQKKSKKGRKADKHKAAEPTDKKINHSFDIMEAFSQLKVEAPVTSTKVGAAVDALNERKEHWLKRREEVKAKGDDAGSDDGNNGKGSTAATTSSVRQQPNTRKERKPFDLGAAEPTPAEAAAGRAPAPSSADAPTVASGGVWKTLAAPADPRKDSGAPTANNGAAAGVKVDLTHADDGTVQLALRVEQ